MASREVRVGVGTFRRAVDSDTPLWGFALFGDTVDVHPDDLERFDSLNGSPAQGEGAPKAPEATEPPRAGKGSGLDSWVSYAESRGLSVAEGATRDEVIALVDKQK